MDLSWLKTVAPTVATALSGPLAGLAVTVIGKAFNIEAPTMEKVQEALKNGQLTSEDIAKLQLAEQSLKRLEIVQKFKFAELEIQDRKSAREMQMTTRSIVPAALSFIVTVGYFGILLSMLRGWIKVEDSQALLLMLGSLSTAWGMVMSFWFGTTRGSEIKTEMIAQSSPLQNPPTK